MKAIKIHDLARYSATDPAPSSALEIVEIPTPKPAEGELLIQLKATTVIRDNLTWPELYHDPPAGLGNDFAGIVVAVHGIESTFKIGQEVYGMAHADKGGRSSATECDDGASGFAEHAKLPTHGDHSKTVLVTGASGGVGVFVVQLAALAGYRVIAASRSIVRNEGYLTSLGATQCMEYNDLPAISPGVDAVMDTVGENVLEQCWEIVKPGGALISVASSSYDFAEEHRSKSVAKDNVDAKFFIVEPSSENMKHISEVFEANPGFQIPIARIMPLEQAQDAYDLVQKGEAGKGKVVLTTTS